MGTRFATTVKLNGLRTLVKKSAEKEKGFQRSYPKACASAVGRKNTARTDIVDQSEFDSQILR